MAILRIFVNGLIMTAEILAVAGIAAFAFHYPFLFAAVTAGLSFLLGLRLEVGKLLGDRINDRTGLRARGPTSTRATSEARRNLECPKRPPLGSL